jgi:GNAT superfamily N-acetyltransferase
MERPVIPMSWEEYEVLERPFGWKVEYWDGHAHLTPRSIGVRTKMDLSPRDRLQNHNLIPVHPDYREQMIAGYLETFRDSVEFCGRSIESILESAAKDVGNYFTGRRGEALSASVIALEPDSEKLAGLALFILRPNVGPYMDLLYVRPAFQRQGMGQAMLAWGIDRLIESGFQEVSSAYHVCNDLSRAWHHQQGFQDVYDSYYSQMKMRWCEHEIWRREKLGMPEGLADLRQERDQWESRIDPDEWPF